ncbi:MAG: DUF922 domain-containing protein [Thiotrichales bacterium]|nr:MAG: DUF922 domain-containing protein [Thiotrichales bacterium]
MYYEVAGDTVDALWADVMLKTPVEHRGKKHVAFTKWNISWRFWWYDSNETCDISKVETELDVTYTLPRLDRSVAIPDQVIARWEDYFAALFDHEQGHKDIGLKAAHEIQNKLASMAPRKTCRQLELDANEIARNVIDRYVRFEKAYDRSTSHGLNTGAVFP